MHGNSKNDAAEPVDDEPRDVGDEPRASLPPPTSMRRRAAVFVLLLGGVLAARPLLRETPDERRFVVTLDKAVQHLRLVWRDPSGDVLRQVELRFPRGAPASVERVLRLEPGRYELEIKTETGQSSTEVTRIIDVQPDTSEVRVQGP